MDNRINADSISMLTEDIIRIVKNQSSTLIDKNKNQVISGSYKTFYTPRE